MANDGDLRGRVEKWLLEEGYPLEFTAARAFEKAGFRVWQGLHYKDVHTGLQRATDVLAALDSSTSDRFLRFAFCIECKVSHDKPWVALTSSGSTMAPSACIAQTIADELGSAILWWMAGDEALHLLDVFAPRKRGGFGVCTAFTKDADRFYGALQGAVAAATGYTRRDDEPRAHSGLPSFAVAAVPVVVLDGPLFEAFVSDETERLSVEAAPEVRIHWRGAEAWPLLASVDVVTKPALEAYVNRRRNELPAILKVMATAYDNINECVRANSLKPLRARLGPRGVLGLPSLLQGLPE